MNQPSQFQPQMKPAESSAPTGSYSNPEGGQKPGTFTQQTMADLKSAASDAASRIKERASEVAGQKKEATAGRIGSASAAARRSAESLENEDPNIAWLTHRAADRLQGVADYVRNTDFQTLKTDAENLVRRHPVAFFGGLFVAGLVVGNLLKATAKTGEEEESREDFDDESWEEESHSDFEPSEMFPVTDDQSETRAAFQSPPSPSSPMPQN